MRVDHGKRSYVIIARVTRTPARFSKTGHRMDRREQFDLVIIGNIVLHFLRTVKYFRA